jgi:hypothetical protein
MDLPPFLLDHWLAKYQFASPPIAYDLASSTGPKWTVSELLSLGEGGSRLDDVTVSYAPPEGSYALREAIGAFLGVDPDWVVVTTGASEALSVLFCLAARPEGTSSCHHRHSRPSKSWRMSGGLARAITVWPAKTIIGCRLQMYSGRPTAKPCWLW